MGTQTTTTMSTKRSRRRTRARHAVRDDGLTALMPAKSGIQRQPVPRKGVAARGAAKDACITAGNLNAAALYRLMA